VTFRKRALRKKVGDGKVRERADVSGTVRKQLTVWLEAEAAKGDLVGKAFWDAAQKETLLSPSLLKGLLTEEGKERTASLCDKNKAGRQRYWRRFCTKGQMRKVNEDRKGGLLRGCKRKVREWCEEEMSQGHDLSAQDLLYQYEGEVEELEYQLKKHRKVSECLGEPVPVSEIPEDYEAAERIAEGSNPAQLTSLTDLLAKARTLREGGGKMEESEGEMSARTSDEELRARTLHECASFLTNGMQSKQNRAYHKQNLLSFCGVVERKPDLVFPMTEEESKLVCNLSWYSFDRVVHILSYGSEQDLETFVRNPKEFKEKVEDS